MKICSKCKIEKDLNGFWKDKSRNDNLAHTCKKCRTEYNKKYYQKNKENKSIYDKIYRKNNNEKITKYQKKYNKENQNRITKRNKNYAKKYNNSKVDYDTFASQISYADKVKNINGLLQVKCTYCRKWCFPTNLSVKNRINSLNGSQTGEQRLYCSEECKQICPIFHKHKFQKGHPKKNQNSSREVQPELRQMVFERDEYTCIICGKHQDDLDVALHCHHMEGIQHNPIESADMDICVTVCKDCHEEIHKQKDCGYNDMKCERKE